MGVTSPTPMFPLIEGAGTVEDAMKTEELEEAPSLPSRVPTKASLRARAREPYYVYLEIIDSYNYGRRAESVIDPLPRLKYSRLRKTE